LQETSKKQQTCILIARTEIEKMKRSGHAKRRTLQKRYKPQRLQRLSALKTSHFFETPEMKEKPAGFITGQKG